MGQSKRVFMEERERDERPFFTEIIEKFLSPRSDKKTKKIPKRRKKDA